MNKLEERKREINIKVRGVLRDNEINNKLIETREIIKVALERASIYKHQKVLMMIELLGMVEDGDLE